MRGIKIKKIGLISIVIALKKEWKSDNVRDFLKSLLVKNIEYEVIFCIGSNLKSFKELAEIVKAYENTAAYEVLAKDLDTVTSFGLEIALGDWVIELHDEHHLEKHFEMMISTLQKSKEVSISNIILKPNRVVLRDKMLLTLNSIFTQSKVVTFQLTSRASSREALIYWNRRAFKNKVLRLAPAMHSNSFHPKAIELTTTANYHNSNLFKIGIRNIVYSSLLPLRFVALVALSSATMSTLYSAYVLFIRYSESSAPGWASTNLILSTMSLSLFVILYAICEYLYQIVGAVVQNSSTGVSNETLNKNYSFRERENIESLHSLESSE